jgi:hypothetical protein
MGDELDWIEIYNSTNEWILRYEYILVTLIIAAAVFAVAAALAFFGKGKRIFMDNRDTYNEKVILRFYGWLCLAVSALLALTAADVFYGAGIMWIPLPVLVLVIGFVYAEKSDKFRK